MTSAPRMALQYTLLFGASGVTLPFAGLWFRAQGLSGAQIGVLLAVPMLARALTGPLILFALRFKEQRQAPFVVQHVAGVRTAAAARGFMDHAVDRAALQELVVLLIHQHADRQFVDGRHLDRRGAGNAHAGEAAGCGHAGHHRDRLLTEVWPATGAADSA